MLRATHLGWQAKASRRLIRTIVSPILLAMVLSMQGCGLSASQKSAVGRYAAATEVFAQTLAKEFSQTRDDTIAMQRMRIRLDKPRLEDLDAGMNIPDLSARLSAITALHNYAKGLEALATNDQSDEIKSAVDSLIVSFQSIEDVDVDAAQLNAVGALVQYGGLQFIEHKKKQHIKEIVPATDPVIVKLMGVIQRSFDESEDYWIKDYKASLLFLDASIASYLAVNGADPDKDLVAEARALQERCQDRLDHIPASIQEAVKTLDKARLSLITILNNPDYSTDRIDEYIQHVEKLTAIIKSF